MTPETQVWILTGLSAFLLTMGWWSVKRWVQQIDSKFDQLILAVQKLSESNVKQNGDITRLSSCVDVADKRLNDHSKRINNLEIKCGNE